MPSLKSIEIFNTLPFTSDGRVKSFQWANTFAWALHIKKAVVWHGLDLNHLSDFVSKVWIAGGILSSVHEDHYQNGSRQYVFDFGSDYMRIPVGGTVQLDTFAMSISGPHSAHVVVTIWCLGSD